MNKNVYYYSKNEKIMFGDVAIEGNFILLTAQKENTLSNIVNLGFLEDMGISSYMFLRFVPDNVTTYNLTDSLKILINIAIASFYKNIQKTSLDYDVIIRFSLNQLDNFTINTASNRILYGYLKKIYQIGHKNCSELERINIFSNVFIYAARIEYNIVDCIFLKYCLLEFSNNYIHSKVQLKKISSCLKIIDALMLSSSASQYKEQSDILSKLIKSISNQIEIKRFQSYKTPE